MATQNEILLKANEVTAGSTFGSQTQAAGGGILKPAQANRFIDFIVDQSVIMQNSRFVRMRTPVMEIDKVAVGTRLLVKATEVTDNSVNVPVTFSKVSLSTTKMRLDWAISTESLEDNIEGAGLEDHIAQIMARQTANDLDDMFINGNASLAGSSTLTGADGFIKLALAGGKLVDELGASASRSTFDRLLRALPSKYLQRRGELRYFSGSGVVQDTIYSLSNPNSATANVAGAPSPASTVGDMAYLQGSMRGQGGIGTTGLAPYGIPLIEVPLMPETAGNDYSGTGNHGYVELTFPNNRIIGVHRDITVYRQFKPKTDMIEYTQFMRVGSAIENLDAYAIAKNIKMRA